jgi:adenylate kinase family enzyme
VKRVVVLGRGGAGKSTVAVQLGMLTGLPVMELDKHFWSSDLSPLYLLRKPSDVRQFLAQVK